MARTETHGGLRESIYEERRVYKLDLFERLLTEPAEIPRHHLARVHFERGEALEAG